MERMDDDRICTGLHVEQWSSCPPHFTFPVPRRCNSFQRSDGKRFLKMFKNLFLICKDVVMILPNGTDYSIDIRTDLCVHVNNKKEVPGRNQVV